MITELVVTILLAPFVAVAAYVSMIVVFFWLMVLSDRLSAPVITYCDIDPRCNPKFLAISGGLGRIEQFLFMFDDNGGYKMVKIFEAPRNQVGDNYV